MLVSPGYDMEKSLRHMTPLADMVITLHAKSFFLTQNYDTLASENKNGTSATWTLKTPPSSYRARVRCFLRCLDAAMAHPVVSLRVCWNAVLKKLYRSRSMHEFHQNLHFFDGKASSEEYFNTHNPSRVLDQIRKPSVYINAYDVRPPTEPPSLCPPSVLEVQVEVLTDLLYPLCSAGHVLPRGLHVPVQEPGGPLPARHGAAHGAGGARHVLRGLGRGHVALLHRGARVRRLPAGGGRHEPGRAGGREGGGDGGRGGGQPVQDVGATGAAVALSLTSTTRTLTSVLGGLGEEEHIRVVETLTEQRDELCAVVQQQQQTDSSDSSDSEDDLPPGLCTLTADSTVSTSSSVTSTSSAGTRREEESQLETGRSAKSVVFVHKVVVSAAAGVEDPLVQVLAQ